MIRKKAVVAILVASVVLAASFLAGFCNQASVVSIKRNVRRSALGRHLWRTKLWDERRA